MNSSIMAGPPRFTWWTCGYEARAVAIRADVLGSSLVCLAGQRCQLTGPGTACRLTSEPLCQNTEKAHEYPTPAHRNSIFRVSAAAFLTNRRPVPRAASPSCWTPPDFFLEVGERAVKKVRCYAAKGRYCTCSSRTPRATRPPTFEAGGEGLVADVLNLNIQDLLDSKGERLYDTLRNLEAMACRQCSCPAWAIREAAPLYAGHVCPRR